jgi:teichuronic acid biosynthesis glycosyltransferase TuaC
MSATEGRSTSKIRTLLFSTLFPSSTRTVHGLFVQARLRELLKSGQIETQVVAPVPWVPWTARGSRRYAGMHATPPSETLEGLTVHHPRYVVVPKLGMSMVPFTLALAALPTLRSILRSGFEFDLIDAHYYYPDGVAAALLGRWLSKPVVVTARGTDLLLIGNYRIPRRQMVWAANATSASIGVCSALTNVLRKWGIPDSKLHTFRNGVDLHRFINLPQILCREQLSLRGDPVILSVGHLVERKGHDVIISAMPRVLQRFPRAHLYVIGEGEERARLSRLIAELGVENFVTLQGAVANELLPPWYNASDLLVLASHREGWPNVILEAMACGAPVVATNVGGVAEILTRSDLGRVSPERTPEDIASLAIDILANPPSREEVRAFASTMSWDQTSANQLELFESIVKARVAGST